MASSAFSLLETWNIDFQDLPYAELSSSSSGTVLIYFNPSFSTFSVNSGYFSFIKLKTKSERINGVEPPSFDGI